MKNSQSGMARNWNDEGELFDDPLSDEEYADTQAMTRIERVMSEYGKMHSKRKIMQYCPGNWILGAPKLDAMPLIVKKSRFIGCRGKTCWQCWNEKIEHDQA